MQAAGTVMSLPDAPMLLLAGCLLLLSVWLLAKVRGEHITTRTLAEGVVLTLCAAGAALAHYPLHPIVFVVLLYAVLMRSRLCVDAGNLLAARGIGNAAQKMYAVALRLGPSAQDRVLVLLNEGILALKESRYPEALDRLTRACDQRQALGTRQQAGCLYNLGVCYEKTGRGDDAVRTYQEAIHAHPASEFGRRAQRAVERWKAARKAGLSGGEEDT